MRRFDRVLQVLAVLMLLLSLGSAPVVDALTHGPGTLAAEADHAVWHAEKGGVWQADSHPYHDASDHDHSTVIILSNQDHAAFDLRTATPFSDLPTMSGATHDGPRRPPRDTV